MSVNDGFGILVGFAVIGGIILGELHWRQMKRKPVVEPTAKRVRRRKDDDEELNREDSEFDGAILFGDYWFPPEIEDLDN